MARLLGQNYISLEIIVENEVIKFIIWVPKDYVETFEKMISSFYPGSVVDEIKRPKLLEAWKFMYWWYFVLEKDDAYPIKSYECCQGASRAPRGARPLVMDELNHCNVLSFISCPCDIVHCVLQ